MILAGVLLKLGAYGFLRLILPLYPEQALIYAGALALLATAAIVFGAFGSYGQTTSSVWWRTRRSITWALCAGHRCRCGCLRFHGPGRAGQLPDRSERRHPANVQPRAFGGGHVFLVGVIYERTHTRNLNDFGGLFPLVPIYGGILIFTSMASLGLPGLNGFVSEFLVVRGSWPILTVYTVISMLGLLFTGAYILKGIKSVLHGR